MPTAIELAQQREARKLAQAGFKPDGTPTDDEPDDEQDDEPGVDEAVTLRNEIAALKRELQAANGRVAPGQQQTEEYRKLWQQTEASRAARELDLNAQIESLRTQLESANNTFDPTEILTQEERDAIDPGLLQTVVKLADKIAQNRAPKVDVRSETLRVMEEREATKVVNYRNQVLNDPARGLHQLGALTSDPDFLAWVQEDENDIDSVVNSLLNAKSTEEVDRYAKIVSKRIVKFKERTKKPADAKTALAGHMRREPKQQLSEAEMQAKVNEAKQLARSRNPADRLKAQQIINSLN